MKIDLTSKIAAVMLAFLFLSNDLIATTGIVMKGFPAAEMERTRTSDRVSKGNSTTSERERIREESDQTKVSQTEFSTPIQHDAPDPFEPVRSRLEREYASEIDFEVLNTEEEMVGVALSPAEVANIPTHILNITRNAPAYHLEGSSNQAYHIAIGINSSKLKNPSDLNEVQVFFFDRLTRRWQTAQTISIDREKLRVEAMVPGETDYFAGLIKAPDMPEASAYVPTNISDVEPANPATGMRLMQAPQVNRTGSASINYPLWIPQGRNGMTPRLAVTYNSDAGTGWMGVGWNIATSSISVDTKWGVPTYDEALETEPYVLDGEELYHEGGKRPNRPTIDGNGQLVLTPRATGEVRFFPKVMNAYQEIERIGDDPANYIWVVTDASSTKRYYGTAEGQEVDENSVLRTDGGDIAQWYLKKVEDKWGNTIDYSYTITENQSTGTMKSGGKSVYLSSIAYTGFGGDPGHYSVHFYTSGNRADGRVQMNYGSKVIDDRRLDRIEVKYDGATLVEYVFNYQNDRSTQFKTLLKDIIEKRGESEFYQHSMDYHEGELTYETTADVISVPSPRTYLSNAPWYVDMLGNLIYDELPASPLSTSTSDGWGKTLGFGLGASPQMFGVEFSKSMSVVISGGSSKSENRQVRDFRDVNGDGLSDVIYDRGNRITYRPMQRSESGQLSLGAEFPIMGISSINLSNSSSNTAKVEVVGPGSVVSGGVNWNSSHSFTNRQLLDYNSDGFMDMMYRSSAGDRILFGVLNENGSYQFEGTSLNTPNPVMRTQEVEVPKMEGGLKSYEIVRVWEAFANGTIAVSGQASIVAGQTGTVDIAVQKNSNFVSGFQSVTPVQPINVALQLNVSKGDKILFRVRPGEDGHGDILNWDPGITYTGGGGYEDGQSVDWNSTNSSDGFLLTSSQTAAFKADQKFKVHLNFDNSVLFSDDVSMRIDVYTNQSTSPFTSYKHVIPRGTTGMPESVLFDPLSNPVPFLDGHLGSGTYYDMSTGGFGVSSTDTLVFKFSLASTSNVQWNAVRWTPLVEFEDDCSDLMEDVEVIPEIETYDLALQVPSEGKFLDGVEPGYNFHLQPNVAIDEEGIEGIFSFPVSGNTTDEGVVYMTVKSEGEVIEQLGIVFKGNASNPAGNTIVFEAVNPIYWGDDFRAGVTLTTGAYNNNSFVSFSGSDVQEGLVKIEFHAKGPFARAMLDYLMIYLEIIDVYQQGVGHISTCDIDQVGYYLREWNELQRNYLNWGAFAWSPLEGEESFPIDTGDLHFPLNNVDPSTVDPEEMTQNPELYDPADFEFWTLLPERTEETNGLWNNQIQSISDKDRYSLMGSQVAWFREPGKVSPGYPGEMEEAIEALPQEEITTDPMYVIYGALNENFSQSLGTNVGAFSAGVAASFSDPWLFYSRSMNLFSDLNGDGYPDLLYDNDRSFFPILTPGSKDLRVCLTDRLGGLTPPVSLNTENRISKGTFTGTTAQYSGTFGNNDIRFTVGASVGNTWERDRETFLDINGDGLPDAFKDKVLSGDVEFYLNKGGDFESSGFVSTNSGEIRQNAFNASLSVHPLLNLYNVSFATSVMALSGGLNINSAKSDAQEVYLDVNGDGLPDYLDLQGSDRLFINRGTDFVEYAIEDDFSPGGVNESGSTGFSGQFNATVAPVIFFIKLVITGGYSDNYALNRVKSRFEDMNGDGAPDVVLAEDGKLKVHYATFGKANKLKTVHNPLGGSFTVDYDVVGNKRGYHSPVIKTHLSDLENEKMLWDMPNSKLVMSSLVISDGVDLVQGSVDIDGEDELRYTFAYDGGIKSRRDRDFLGFTRVATIEDNHLNILEDFCHTNTDLEIEKPRNTAGWYNPPYTKTIPDPTVTGVKPTGRYNMQVVDYIKPEGIDPESMCNYVYRASLPMHNYAFHVHTWRDSVEVGIWLNGQGGEPDFTRIDKWNHSYVQLLSDQDLDYELRVVETDPGKELFGQVVAEGPADDWLLLEEIESLLGPSETRTVFPAVTDKREKNYPVVEDHANVNLQKFRIKYDSYFNVVWFEDYGELTDVQLDTVPVDTIYTGYYKYLTQPNSCEDLETYEIIYHDHLHYTVVVPCEDTSFENDSIYGTFASPCGNHPGSGPLDSCAEGGPGGFTSVHRKWETEETILYEIIDNSSYTNRVIATMDYFPPSSAAGRTNALKEHYVYSGTLSNPQRRSKVLSLFNGLAPSSMAQYPESGQQAITDLTYDSYGNVTQIVGPANATAQRGALDFTYDSQVFQFVTRVENQFGDFSCSLYDFGHQKLLQTTDVNGHIMRYEYDAFQRPTAIWAPREIENNSHGPTIAFEYYPSGNKDVEAYPYDYVPVAITHHNTGNTSADVVYGQTSENCDALIDPSTWNHTMTSAASTATFTDAMNRAIQIQVTNDWDDPNTTGHTMQAVLRVSGNMKYNKFGLQILQENDFLETNGTLGHFVLNSTDSVSRTEYDYASRAIKSESVWSETTPTNNWTTTTIERKWLNLGGVSRFVEETSIDGASLQRSYIDHKGRQVASFAEGQSLPATSALTVFEYDNLGQLDTVTNPLGEKTHYEYDWFGRVVEENHPDRGITLNTYDLAGNLIQIKTPATGTDHIALSYDYNRLVSKEMPSGSVNADLYNVEYVYGSRGDGKNGAGRVVQVTQGETAAPVLVENLKYDELGQRAYEQRLIDVPQKGVQGYVTQFRYDSFGRMLRMVYPDAVQLDYQYTAFGALESVTPTKGECTTVDLIQAISYDGFDNIVYMLYGNGTETEYSYHDVTRALMGNTVKAIAPGYSYGEVMNRSYTYNSLGMVETAEHTPHNSLVRGDVTISANYQYEGLLRLKQADVGITVNSTNALTPGGDCPVQMFLHTTGPIYSVATEYNQAGGITNKSGEMHNSSALADPSLEYDLNYTYDTQSKHKIDEIEEQGPGGTTFGHFAYNTSGSIEEIVQKDAVGDVLGKERMLWNEEQMLIADSNDQGIHHYIYDYTGERIMKSSFTQQSVWQNGENVNEVSNLDPYRVYVNPYVVKSYFSGGDHTTHHYYMGMQRIASGRFLEGGPGPIDPLLKTVESDTGTQQENQVMNQLKGILSGFGLNEGVDYTKAELEETPTLEEYYPQYSNAKTNTGSGSTSETELQEVGGEEDPTACEGVTSEVYWYHPNYLGSVDMVTDISGEVHQYFLYNAWGENMYTHNSYCPGFDSPYRFNGKELDPETGLHYYGARYYANKAAIWLSVDPLSSEAPHLIPYHFVSNNPVMRVDPDGRRDIVFNDDGTYKETTNDNFWHNLWYGSRGVILDGQGETRSTFSFADPENDVAAIQSGEITRVVEVSEQEISDFVARAGGFRDENRENPKDYLEAHSGGGGELDFSYKRGPGGIPDYYGASTNPLDYPSTMIFLVEDVAHNHMNFGNFLWGVTGSSLGVHKAALRFAAHMNSRWPRDAQGNRVDGASANGYPAQFDSADDQKSITLGYYYARNRNWQRRKYTPTF